MGKEQFAEAGECQHCLIIADAVWASQRQDRIDQWLAQNGSSRRGMVLRFQTPSEVAMFLIAWESD